MTDDELIATWAHAEGTDPIPKGGIVAIVQALCRVQLQSTIGSSDYPAPTWLEN